MDEEHERIEDDGPAHPRVDPKELEVLLGVAGAVNSGEVDSMIDVVPMISCGACPSCKKRTRVPLRSNSRNLWVGACPHCGSTTFYIGLPYHACGNIGPTAVSSGNPFYYNVEQLGDLYVEIEIDDKQT